MAANQMPTAPIPEPKLPTLQQAFSKRAGFSKWTSRGAVAAGLLLVSGSAVASVFQSHHYQVTVLTYHINLATSIAAILFLLAGVIRLYRIFGAPERDWFGSRVLAEHTRSLGWRYAVAGTPFPLPGPDPDDSHLRLEQALNEAANEANAAGIDFHMPRGTQEIDFATAWMRQTRERPLDERRALYAELRIKHQERYYIQREQKSRHAAKIAQWALFGIEIAGAGLAALNALAFLNLDLIGVAGTIAAGVTAWTQFNQFTELAGSYDAMAYRMAGYRERCLDNQPPWNEERWAAFVDEVENALREESGTWKRLAQQGAGDSR